ncbi:hypothetical protein I350_00987 [Cryptococcus amylolentus CBS 6273]|uniref:Uncharacterized protein n=1 Tax=Cryptococcus amylolentus CBS 6273 TaxID=1296118 RepID=A0A1E3KDM9_9TREE|nr:hypothetical protein I350_00987 [Cryptococcus amylolentus CBS 6273]
MLFGNALSLLSLAGYVSVNSCRCSNKVDFLSELLGKVFCCSDDNRTDPENGLTCPLRMVHAQGGDVVTQVSASTSTQRLDIASVPGTLLQTAITPGNQRKAPISQKPGPVPPAPAPAAPGPVPVPGAHVPSSSCFLTPSVLCPVPLALFPIALRVNPAAAAIPAAPAPASASREPAALGPRSLAESQPANPTGYHLASVSERGLPDCWAGAGLEQFISPTVAGGALRNYAAPGLWLIGAFVWYPSVIAVWRRVPGAQLRARRWV